MISDMELRIKRVYCDAAEEDGFRVLVDRLWPRGIGKDKAKVDLWARDIAPSDELRKWFGHDPAKFREFAERYRQELACNPEFEKFTEELERRTLVTLLYSAKDELHNNAVVLQSLL